MEVRISAMMGAPAAAAAAAAAAGSKRFPIFGRMGAPVALVNPQRISPCPIPKRLSSVINKRPFFQTWAATDVRRNIVETTVSKEKTENRDGRGSHDSDKEEEEGEEEMEKGYKMSNICDRLIQVLLKERTTPAQWRNLLVLSDEWVRVRSHFFKRCSRNAKAEQDPAKKRALVRLAKQVKEVDDKIILHDELLAEVEKEGMGIDTVVARRRQDFTSEFFDHLKTVSDCSRRAKRRDEIAATAAKCLSVVEAYDAALEDAEALVDAKIRYDEIISSPSLKLAGEKIQQLARDKELDSTLMLLITKAWVAAKDSPTMSQEVKDVMLYLYKTARRSMQKIAPDEIQIMKYLLSIQDPRDRFAALTTAFSAGDELEENSSRRLHTTPQKLLHWLGKVLDAYYSNRQSSLIKEAQMLTNPTAIGRLESLKNFIDEQFI